MTFIWARRAVLLLAVAVVAGLAIWTNYVNGPWTRDGQVIANVVNIAPEVSGRITHLHVSDNQVVHKGDVLYEIDPVDYQVAVSLAEANVNSKLADLKLKRTEATRRDTLTTLSTSQEEQQTYASNADMAVAAYAGALAQLSQAHVNLDRTHVLSPVNGYVTNLLLREGDYATTGSRNIAVLDSDSFYVSGYFEETKLANIHVGDPALAALMGYKNPLRGHVESIARGISTPNTDPGSLGLASVNPVFTWVRLAQRIPVRIHIDAVPDTVHLAAGMTATVTVGADAVANSPHGLISRLTAGGG
jgi:RND family efflux transporter MFP subunit